MTPRVSLTLALALCGLTSGCGGGGGALPLPQPGDSAPTSRPEPEADPEPYRPEPLAEPALDPLAGVPPPGRDRVLWTQTRLNERGYECGDPDGRVGPNTRRCVRAFRADHGLSNEPEIDDALLALLNAPQ